MNYSEKILSSDQKPSRLTRDQEHVIMVSALRQVISNVRGDNTSSSNSVACEALPQPLDAGPCPMCSITGCCGCAFPRREEIKKRRRSTKPPLHRLMPKAGPANYDDAAAKLVKRKASRSGTENGEEA
ncbi:unnamed protein product [Brassica oleracea]